MQGEEFEWDAAKAQINLAKHGVSFEAARLVFDDVFALDRLDAGGGYVEARYILTGGACQEFRVWAMTMGRKEPSHGTPQSTDYP